MTGTNKFDDLLTHLGTGTWNVFHFIVTAYWYFLIPPQTYSGVFLTPAINYTCLPPESNASVVVSEDSCSYTKVTETGEEVEETCTEWDFDTSVFSSTLTSEFSLVCGKKYMQALYQSTYMLSNIFTPLIGGYFADRYGRKVVVVVTQVCITFFAILPCFLDNIIAILCLRFLLGMFNMRTFIIFTLEVCEPKYRGSLGLMIGLPWALGTMLWGGVAFLIRDWRWLQLAVSLPNLLIFPALYVMDESPRWLIVRGHHDRALQVLHKAARWNGVTLQPESELRDLMKDMQEESVQYSTTNTDTKTSKRFRLALPSLLRTRAMRIITIVICIDYFAASFVFDGLNLSGDNFTSNLFLYIALSGLAEVPSYTLTVPIINRWGRRMPAVVFFLLCGIIVSVITFIPPDLGPLMMTSALLGKVCVSGVFQLLYLYSSELFPTEVRMRGIGAGNLFAQIASSIVPFFTSLMDSLLPWLPSLIFGLLSVAAGMLTLALWETKGVPLPDTIADLETINTTTTASTTTIFTISSTSTPENEDHN